MPFAANRKQNRAAKFRRATRLYLKLAATRTHARLLRTNANFGDKLLDNLVSETFSQQVVNINPRIVVIL